MTNRATRIAAILACTTVGVLGLDYATFAATGGSLILGRSNSAGATTSLSNTGTGAALKLTTKSATSAPLAVNGTGKVANLNVDKLDSLDSTQLQRRVTGACATGKAMRAVTATGAVTCATVPRPAVYDLATDDEGVLAGSIDMYSAATAAGTYLVQGTWSGTVNEAVPAYCEVWTYNPATEDFEFQGGDMLADATQGGQMSVSMVVVTPGLREFNWYCYGDSPTAGIVAGPDTRFSVTALDGSTKTTVSNLGGGTTLQSGPTRTEKDRTR